MTKTCCSLLTYFCMYIHTGHIKVQYLAYPTYFVRRPGKTSMYQGIRVTRSAHDGHLSFDVESSSDDLGTQGFTQRSQHKQPSSHDPWPWWSTKKLRVFLSLEKLPKSLYLHCACISLVPGQGQFR